VDIEKKPTEERRASDYSLELFKKDAEKAHALLESALEQLKEESRRNDDEIKQSLNKVKEILETLSKQVDTAQSTANQASVNTVALKKELKDLADITELMQKQIQESTNQQNKLIWYGGGIISVISIFVFAFQSGVIKISLGGLA